MGNETLQSLSRQYAQREIAKPEYRQKRARIIDDAAGIIDSESSQSTEASKDFTSPPLNANSNLILKAGVISVVVIATLIIVFVVI